MQLGTEAGSGNAPVSPRINGIARLGGKARPRCNHEGAHGNAAELDMDGDALGVRGGFFRYSRATSKSKNPFVHTPT